MFKLPSASQVAALCASLGFACVPLAQSGLSIESEVWMHRLAEWLLGKWPSVFFVLHFVFAAATWTRGIPSMGFVWILAPTSDDPDLVGVLLVLQSLKTELAVDSVFYFPWCGIMRLSSSMG